MREAVLYKSARVLIPANQTFGRTEIEIPRGWDVLGVLSNAFSGKTTLKDNNGDYIFNQLSNQFISSTSLGVKRYDKMFIIPNQFSRSRRIIIEYESDNTLSSTRIVQFLFSFTKENLYNLKYLKKDFVIPANETFVSNYISIPTNYFPVKMIGEYGTYELTIKKLSGEIVFDRLDHSFFVQNPDYLANQEDYFVLPKNIQTHDNFIVELNELVSLPVERKYQLLFVLEPKLPIKEESFFDKLKDKMPDIC